MALVIASACLPCNPVFDESAMLCDGIRVTKRPHENVAGHIIIWEMKHDDPY
jgi:hypothetical protein